jgi:hypothetical protein
MENVRLKPVAPATSGRPRLSDTNLTQKQREEARRQAKNLPNSPANKNIHEVGRTRKKALSWIAPRRSTIRFQTPGLFDLDEVEMWVRRPPLP